MKAQAILALLASVLTGGPSWAQEEQSPPAVALSAVTVSAGRVELGAVEVTRTLTLDTASKATWVITSVADLDVQIKRPDGTWVTSTRATDDRYQWHRFNGTTGSHDLPGLGSGFNDVVTMEAPQSGPHTVLLRPKRRLRAAAPFLITLLPASDLRMGLFVPSREALAGAPFLVAAILFNGEKPVRGATITATVTQVANDPLRPVIVSNAVALSDDGLGADAAAGDGIYTGVLIPKTAGQFLVAIQAIGRGKAGTTFERNAGLTFRSSDETVKSRARPRSAAADEDHDGRVDGVDVSLALAGGAGTYDVVVTLRATNGRSIAGRSTVQEVGLSDVSVRFDLEQLERLGVDGPYLIEAVDVFEVTSSDRLLRGRLVNAGSTPSLTIGSLK